MVGELGDSRCGRGPWKVVPIGFPQRSMAVLLCPQAGSRSRMKAGTGFPFYFRFSKTEFRFTKIDISVDFFFRAVFGKMEFLSQGRIFKF